MKIIHSGFDSFYFSIQGALSPAAVKRYEQIKDQAIQQKTNVAFHVAGQSNRYQLQPNGKRGGYTYLIDTGRVGSVICFKSSLARDQHNGFVEISSACLLVHGWREAVFQALEHVQALGFHVVDIRINRVDYCIDFLDASIDINPSDFIAHSRVKKLCYYGSDRVNNHMGIRTVSQSDSIKSITLGKMPGRQVIIYDKRAEVIEKRKLYWFDAWGIDPRDPTRTIHRVEVRAGKTHLMDKNIRTLEDFENHIGLLLCAAVRAIRWVQRPNDNANVTRAPLHPLWEGVQTHMDDALAPYKSPIREGVITGRMRENKCHEYNQQIVGNLGGYLGVKGVPPENMRDEMQALVNELTANLSMDNHPIMKSYNRAREKWD